VNWFSDAGGREEAGSRGNFSRGVCGVQFSVFGLLKTEN
jgi:hypothetical protein